MKKLGKFNVTAQIRLDPENYKNLFKDIVVLNADFDLTRDTIKYIGYSEWFHKVDEGQLIPEYIAEFDSDSVYPRWKLLI